MGSIYFWSIINLKQSVMKGGNEMMGMLELLLSVPGMNVSVKAGVSLSRNQVLLLTNVIIEGMIAKGGMVEQLLKVLPEESARGMQQFADDLMERAELSDLHQMMIKVMN
jgi:hypothetical protein